MSKEGGFTLLEIVVAISIFVGVMATLSIVIINLAQIRFREQAQADVSARSREALDLMAQDLRQAVQVRNSSIPMTNYSGDCNIGGAGATVVHNSDNTSLVIVAPSMNSVTKRAIFIGAFMQLDYIAYYTVTNPWGGHRLCRKVDAVPGTFRQDTAQMLMNNLVSPPGSSIWSYSNGVCWPATCDQASWAQVDFNLRYINPSTGLSGFTGSTGVPEFIGSQRFDFRNQ